MDERSGTADRAAQCGDGRAIDARASVVSAVCGAARLSGIGDEPGVAFEEKPPVSQASDDRVAAGRLVETARSIPLVVGARRWHTIGSFVPSNLVFRAGGTGRRIGKVGRRAGHARWGAVAMAESVAGLARSA